VREWIDSFPLTIILLCAKHAKHRKTFLKNMVHQNKQSNDTNKTYKMISDNSMLYLSIKKSLKDLVEMG
jgi:hypothetical protein